MRKIQVRKKIVDSLEKCYAVNTLKMDGENFILAASEVKGRCQIYNYQGEKIETVWTQIGGVMGFAQTPYDDGSFFATEDFYSPADSKNAKLILMVPCKVRENGQRVWERHVVCPFPYLHRIAVHQGSKNSYLLLSALKSGEKTPGDWSYPGYVQLATLPQSLDLLLEAILDFRTILSGLPYNHGYSCRDEQDNATCLIASDLGVHRLCFDRESEAWDILQQSRRPASDALLLDLNKDGRDELLTIAPFHGDCIEIFALDKEGFKLDSKLPGHFPFLHAICKFSLGTRPAALLGYREGKRETFILYFDENSGRYRTEIIDSQAGAANALCLEENADYSRVICTNRESNELVEYTISLCD